MLHSLYISSSRILCLSGIVGLALFVAPQKTDAAGFYIQEQSVSGLGTAFAGSTTSINDASTIWFNPAGMTELDGRQIHGGVNLLLPRGDIDDTGTTLPAASPTRVDTGNPYSVTPVPNFYAVTPFMENRLWAGIGIAAPFGLGSDYGNTSFGRFDSTETKLTTINVQPSIAFAATDWLSIGGGVDIQYADAELQSIVNVGTGDAISKLTGDDISYGYNVGLTLKPLPRTEIGAHYRSAVSHTLEGRVSLEGTGAAAADFNVTGEADLDLPDIATIGVAHDATDDLRLMGQATWFGWNNFQEIQPIRDDGTAVGAIVQNYQATWSFAIGAEYDINDQWTVRGGYQFDETPTNDLFRTTRTPDGDRNWFSLGATHHINDRLSFDLSRYLY